MLGRSSISISIEERLGDQIIPSRIFRIVGTLGGESQFQSFSSGGRIGREMRIGIGVVRKTRAVELGFGPGAEGLILQGTPGEGGLDECEESELDRWGVTEKRKKTDEGRAII